MDDWGPDLLRAVGERRRCRRRMGGLLETHQRIVVRHLEIFHLSGAKSWDTIPLLPRVTFRQTRLTSMIRAVDETGFQQ